jgi:hypothetical protein
LKSAKIAARVSYSEAGALALSADFEFPRSGHIKSAISEGRKHLDLEALKSVLAKLTAAHNWKTGRAG